MGKHDDIQEEIVGKILKFFETEKQGYIDGAMRLGKIFISLKALQRMYLLPPVVIIAYPDNKIKTSWEDECNKWGYDNPYIMYVNFSSLYKHKDTAPDFFIIDEFHDASDLQRDYCHQIMTNSTKTKTLALSGTVSKETKAVWGLKEIAKYTTAEGIEDGILSDYKITVHLVNLDTKIKTPNKKNKLLSEKERYDNYTFVIEKMKRDGNNFMFLALSRNRLSLSSIGKMNYLKKLLETLKDKRVLVFTGLANVADSIGIPSYHSKSKDNNAFIDFKEGRINHLALAAMGKTGVTYLNLDSVILLNFTYNAEETSQILNRAIKLDYVGKVADLHVLCLNEKPELKKIEESLSMLDKSRIKYIHV